MPLATGSAAVRVGTIGSGEALAGMALMQPTTVKVYALTADSRLASFDPTAPAALAASVPISGLSSGESVLGIDFRPANGKLYALTSTARALTVELNTGARTVVAPLSADVVDTTLPYTGLGNAERFAVDFNPVADRLRVISDSGLNLRINADTGATTTDGTINRAGAAPMWPAVPTAAALPTRAAPCFMTWTPPAPCWPSKTRRSAARRPWTMRAALTAWCWWPCARAPPARTRCTPCR